MGSGVSFGSRRARKQPRLEGHEGSVNAVSLTSDGGLVVTGSDDCTARVWDAETRELVAEMKGHTQYVTCLTITANDEFVVTGRYLITIGFRMKPPRAVNDTMSDVCVHGCCFAGSADTTLRKWDIFSGSCKTVYEGHEAVIHCVLVHQLSLFSSSYDKTARHWNIKTGECLQVYVGHLRAVSPLIFVNLSVADRRTERRKSRVKMERKLSTASQLKTDEHKSLLISGIPCSFFFVLSFLHRSTAEAFECSAV